jgi:hypothetical protein
MPVILEDLEKRFTELEEQREPWEAGWQEITDYVLPRRSFWDLDAQAGKKPEVKIFDGAALNALQLLVDGLQGYLISPSIRWYRLEMENKEQQKLPGVADWLEETEDVMYAEFARSNFYEAISEFFLDAASIGTAAMLVEDELAEKRILFSTRHIKECYISEARNGTVDTLYREFMMTNRQMLQMWGDKLSKERQAEGKEDPFGKVVVRHFVYPRRDRMPGKADSGSMAWSSVYVDEDKKTIVDEGGYESFPYLVWRWRKNSDEVYGRSPASDAINDILRANQISKNLLQAAQLAVQPPMNIPMAMKGMERLVPKGANYYTNPQEIISPINMAQNYPIGMDQENAVKEQIKETFRTKIFLLMEQLEGGPFTATEIRERQGEKAAVLGATIGRLNSETLVPLIDRVYAICSRNAILPPPPDTLSEGGRVHVEFTGPLYQAQKKYHAVQGIESGLGLVAAMAKFLPDSLDNVDEDELIRIGMDSNGMPQKVIREIPMVQEIRRKKAQAMAAQRQEAMALEKQKIMGANADQLNKPLQPDSMLAQVAGQGG